MPQLQAAIVGHNNTRAAVTGQEELLVRVNSSGATQDVNIISPIGPQLQADSISISFCKEQYNIPITPVIISSSGDTATNIPDAAYSISFASIGTADALVSFDGGSTYVNLAAGTSLNMDAGGLNNYYPNDQFYYDTNTNAGAALLITYNLFV